MKKCSNCGKGFLDEVKYCPFCGTDSFIYVNDTEVIEDDVGIHDLDAPNGEKLADGSQQVLKELFVCKIMEIAGAILCIIGVFLPFVRASILGVVIEKSFSDLAAVSDCVVFVVIAIVGLVGALFEKQRLTILAGIAYAALLYYDTHDYFAKLSENEYGSFLTKGMGFYCMIAGITLMIVIGIVGDLARSKHMKKDKKR